MLINKDNGILTITLELIEPKLHQAYYFKVQLGNLIKHTQKLFENCSKQTVVFIGDDNSDLEITMFKAIEETSDFEVAQWFLTLHQYLYENQMSGAKVLILKNDECAIKFSISWCSIFNDTQNQQKKSQCSEGVQKRNQTKINKNIKKQKKNKDANRQNRSPYYFTLIKNPWINQQYIGMDICMMVVQLEILEQAGDQALLSQVNPFYVVQHGNQLQHTQEILNYQNYQKQTFVFIKEANQIIKVRTFKTILKGFYENVDQIKSFNSVQNLNQEFINVYYLTLQLTKEILSVYEVKYFEKVDIKIQLKISQIYISRNLFNSQLENQIQWKNIIEQKISLLSTQAEKQSPMDKKNSQQTKPKINKKIKKLINSQVKATERHLKGAQNNKNNR